VKRIFVFGTLKKGFPLHRDGLEGASYIGAYRTVERFPMLIAGPWFGPMMNEPGRGPRVRGELYEVDDWRVNRLDELESGTDIRVRIAWRRL
jgi:gamma-glutamylaminecyclotransferase